MENHSSFILPVHRASLFDLTSYADVYLGTEILHSLFASGNLLRIILHAVPLKIGV